MRIFIIIYQHDHLHVLLIIATTSIPTIIIIVISFSWAFFSPYLCPFLSLHCRLCSSSKPLNPEVPKAYALCFFPFSHYMLSLGNFIHRGLHVLAFAGDSQIHSSGPALSSKLRTWHPSAPQTSPLECPSSSSSQSSTYLSLPWSCKFSLFLKESITIHPVTKTRKLGVTLDSTLSLSSIVQSMNAWCPLHLLNDEFHVGRDSTRKMIMEWMNTEVNETPECTRFLPFLQLRPPLDLTSLMIHNLEITEVKYSNWSPCF